MTGSPSPRSRQRTESQHVNQEHRANNVSKESSVLRPESAPPNKHNIENRNTFEKNTEKSSSKTSLHDSEKNHSRKNSLTGRFFSAFE